MSVTVRADDAPARDRIDYWEHAIAGKLLPLRGRPGSDRDFRAEMVSGTVRVARLNVPGGECFRSPRQIDPDGRRP